MTEAKFGYMDGVDWQHELGHASGGNKIYPDLADLERHQRCVKSCGAVRVAVTLEQWVKKQDMKSGTKPHTQNLDRMAVEQAQGAVKYLKKALNELTPKQMKMFQKKKKVGIEILVNAMNVLKWNMAFDRESEDVGGMIIGTDEYVDHAVAAIEAAKPKRTKRK